MKTIKKDELFESLGDFLKLKGVELKDGAYAKRIRKKIKSNMVHLS